MAFCPRTFIAHTQQCYIRPLVGKKRLISFLINNHHLRDVYALQSFSCEFNCACLLRFSLPSPLTHSNDRYLTHSNSGAKAVHQLESRPDFTLIRNQSAETESVRLNYTHRPCLRAITLSHSEDRDSCCRDKLGSGIQ